MKKNGRSAPLISKAVENTACVGEGFISVCINGVNLMRCMKNIHV
jgi:hypothetical protein